MKNHRNTLIKWTTSVAACLALCAATTVVAQPFTNIVQGFDTFESALTGPVGGSAAVAPNVALDWIDTDGSTGNGCMYMQVPWVDTAGDWQEIQLGWENPVAWPGVVAAPYATLEYDVKVVGTPDMGTDGTYGNVQMVLQGWTTAGANADWTGTNSLANWITLGQVPITNAGTWVHVSHKLIAFEPYNCNKVVFNIVGRTCTNTITYLLDNIQFKVPTNDPPALTVGGAPPAGLHLVTAGGPGDRQMLRTTASTLRWWNRTGPVKYAFTINSFPPGDTHDNYMAFMLLMPNAKEGTAPDWDGTNVLRLDVQNHGTGMGYLRFKTNAPGSNGGFYNSVTNGGGSYPGVPSSTVLGEWSLTFLNNTNVTVTAPDGTSSNYVLNAAANFNGPNFRAYFGAQANETANVGQEAILSSVNISGTLTPVSDTFTDGTLDTTKWEVQAAQPNNVFELGSVKVNISWPLPDNLFRLITSPTPGNMTNSGLPLTVGATERAVNVPFNYPSTDKGFFALAKRAYTKLQVLMPGETAAPGTVSGKTGTPINQKAGTPFQVKVVATDDNWNRAFSTHPVTLWSTPGGDGSGFAWKDQLIHGTNSYTFTNTTAGTFQIGVQDIYDTNVTGITGTGSSYTVIP